MVEKEKELLVIDSKFVLIRFYENERKREIVDIAYTGLQRDPKGICAPSIIHEEYKFEVLKKKQCRSYVRRFDRDTDKQSTLVGYFIPVREIKEKREGTIEISIIFGKNKTEISIENFIYRFNTNNTFFDHNNRCETSLEYDDVNIITNVMLEIFKKNISFQIGNVGSSYNSNYFEIMMRQKNGDMFQRY